ncbi:MAG: hypothetical protein WKF75_05905 [Singulisphaera sp.]
MGATTRFWMWGRRRPALAGLAAAFLLALTTGTVVSTLLAIRASRQAVRANREARRADDQTAVAVTNARRAAEEAERARRARRSATPAIMRPA